MSLSIKTKIWLPAIAVSIGLVLMSTGSAVRTVKSQAITVKEQSDQQSKLELSARWRGLAEAQALRTLGAALAADEASAALLQGGQEQAQHAHCQVDLPRAFRSWPRCSGRWARCSPPRWSAPRWTLSPSRRRR